MNKQKLTPGKSSRKIGRVVFTKKHSGRYLLRLLGLHDRCNLQVKNSCKGNDGQVLLQVWNSLLVLPGTEAQYYFKVEDNN